MIKGLRKGRKSRYSDEEICRMRYLYGEGYTYDQLGEMFRCSHETISYYCVRGHKERKIERQLRVQRENPEHYAEIRNRHRNKYSTKYQRRWRMSKRLKQLKQMGVNNETEEEEK